MKVLQLLLFLFAIQLSTARSQDIPSGCEITAEDCIEKKEWNFAISTGLGFRSNPVLNNNNIPLILLPEISYYDDHFFIENLDIGYTFYELPTSSTSLIATPSYDSVFFNSFDPGNLLLDAPLLTGEGIVQGDPSDSNLPQVDAENLRNRHFGYLAGLEFTKEFDNSSLLVSFLTDLTNDHSGKEVRFAYNISTNKGFNTALGFTWKDQKLTNYYYSVDQNESFNGSSYHSKSASLNPFIRISFKQQPTIENKDIWYFTVQYQKLDKVIVESPLVYNNYVLTFFVGKRFQL